MVILFPNLPICGGCSGSGVPIQPATLPLDMIELMIKDDNENRELILNILIRTGVGEISDESDENEWAKIRQFRLLWVNPRKMQQIESILRSSV